MSILKSIASWKILAPALIAVMVTWLMISCVIFISSVRATGRVVQLVEKGSGDDVCYYPVTVFRDTAGIEHTIRSSGSSNPPRFPVGSTVSVLYRTQNPDAGMIEDRFMMGIAPLLFIALGVFYGSIGLVIGRWLQKKETRNAA
jgi:hypothetical protein